MNTRKLYLTATLTLLVGFAMLTTGCGGVLVGSWKADPEPKDMPAYISTASFKNDGTYSAVEKKGDAVDKFAGTYEFNGFNLKLKSPGKPDKNYKACCMWGKSLELTDAGKKITLKKQQ